MTSTKEAALEWLSLVESSGIYLAPKVLDAAFPQSLDSVDTVKRQRLRSAWEEWREAVDAHDPQLAGLHREWLNLVLTELLEYKGTILRPVEPGDEEWTFTAYDTGTLTRPDWLLRTQDDPPKAAVFAYPPDKSLDRAGKNAVSPIEQVTAWCRAKGVRNALLTDGERWTLLDAPEGAVSGSITWYARLWWLEPVTLRAFYSLLRARNFFGRQEGTFPQLVDDSQEYRDEVTTTLGEQVERAVEVLVRALDRANRDRNGKLLDGVDERELYEAGLTVMMRLVFILSAEERGLLLLGDPVWDANYAVSTLRSQLEEIDDRDGHGVLQRRYDAWNRLLAVFRALYGGIEHESLRLPALGGSLFDPDRFPFLEGRPAGTSWRDPETKPEPLPIDNRTVLLLLNALQKLAKKDGAQTLSYRALDVEQIGHVYEGLLERTVSRVDDVTLGLKGAGKTKTPDLRLSELESARFDGTERLVEVLKEKAGLSDTAIRRALNGEVSPDQQRALSQACDGDRDLVDAILPFANLLRTDPWDEPVVYRKDAFAVTSGSDRSNTGAHYTPKALTERIVGTTLEPVVYVGPAEGLPREEWKLKSAAELLDLKICDPAMGSGAFLVQTCRWLSEKVVQAWAQAEEEGQAVTAEGEVVPELAGHEPMPADPEERLTLARRLVAERCLYGVDINPVAVELAKLSIWLVTLAKNRPFGFLDHNLRHGDSLLGIRDLDQLTSLSMTPKPGDQQYIFATNIREAVDEAVELRKRLRAIPIRDIRDVQQMAKLDEQARRILQRPELAADALIGEAMRHAGRPNDLSVALRVASTEIGKMTDGDMEGEQAVAKRAKEALAVDLPFGKNPRKPMHWPLEFPEVFLRENGGFDAFVGNPPFQGGKMITLTQGEKYYAFLDYVRDFAKGSPNLCVFFLLQYFFLLKKNGVLGVILSDAAKETESKSVGFSRILKMQGEIFWAISSMEWPGAASTNICIVGLVKGNWTGRKILNERTVSFISDALTEIESGEVRPLAAMRNIMGSEGYSLMGTGFVLSAEEAKNLLDDAKNERVIFPYFGGKDVMESSRLEPKRWAIDFGEVDLSIAQSYVKTFERVVSLVKPMRDAQTKPNRQSSFWKYKDMRHNLREYMASGKSYLAMTTKAKYVAFREYRGHAIFNHNTRILFSDSRGEFCVLQSSIHEVWARSQSKSVGSSTILYSATHALSTFPLPPINKSLSASGDKYMSERQLILESRFIGLTDFYNLLHNRNCNDEDIIEFRKVIKESDIEVCNAYGWGDVNLDHGFHTMDYLPENDNVRFSISEKARLEILRRLAKLNQERYEEEQAAQQLPSKSKPKATKTPKASAKAAAPASLFDQSPVAGLVPEKPKQAVLEVLRGGNRWFKKAEVLRESGVSEGEWNLVIAGLVADGTVERRGEKRGTEYMLKR